MTTYYILGWNFLIIWFHSIVLPSLFVGVTPILCTGEKKIGPGSIDNSFNSIQSGSGKEDGVEVC